MRKTIITIAASAGLIFAGVFAFGTAAAYSIQPAPPVTEAAVVKITRPEGLGSGVAIEGGYIITAAHVVKGAKTVSIKSPSGAQGAAEILWMDESRDVAIMHTDLKLPAASLDCRTAEVGEAVTIMGAPLGVEFISSSGRVAGKPRPIGDFRTAMVLDVTAIMGNSGGPVFAGGKIVGIVSMIMVAPMQDTADKYTRSPVGFTFAIPSSEICMLMGRAI